MTKRRREDHRCTCAHYDDVHVRREGRCTGTDSYGFACECVGFEHCDSCKEVDDPDEDDDGDEGPESRPDPRYRHLAEDNGHVDPKETE